TETPWDPSQNSAEREDNHNWRVCSNSNSWAQTTTRINSERIWATGRLMEGQQQQAFHGH
ncbi:Hypothetical predicted protein, partial [Pelobates cultripes]